MNRHDRRAFLGATRQMADKIVREQTWKHRFDGYCGCMQAINDFAVIRNLEAMAVCEEIGGALAKTVIEALGAPAITEIHQAVLYCASSSLAHKAAAVTWQRDHQDELAAFGREHPEAPNLLNATDASTMDEKADMLAVCARADIEASEITDHPEHGICVSAAAVRKLAAIAENQPAAKYLLAQITQMQRRQLHVVPRSDDGEQ
jgi:hypothetical protein